MHTQVTRGDEAGVRTVTDTNRENESKEKQKHGEQYHSKS